MIKIEHFVRPDMTRPHFKSSVFLEMQLPKVLQNALQQEINTRGIDWNSLPQAKERTSLLHLSRMGLISVCELIAPKKADLAEVWKNS